MAGDLKLRFDVKASPDWAKRAEAKIAKATTLAARAAAAKIKADGRKMISASGPNMKNLANALRVNVYPENGVSMDPALWVTHKTSTRKHPGYSALFEEGGTIKGKPYLWVPLPAAKKIMGARRASLQAWIRQFGSLTPLRGGDNPILGAYISSATLRSKKARPRKFGAKRQGPPVPLFVGVPAVSIPKKWSITAIAEREWGKVPAHVSRLLRTG